MAGQWNLIMDCGVERPILEGIQARTRAPESSPLSYRETTGKCAPLERNHLQRACQRFSNFTNGYRRDIYIERPASRRSNIEPISGFSVSKMAKETRRMRTGLTATDSHGLRRNPSAHAQDICIPAVRTGERLRDGRTPATRSVVRVGCRLFLSCLLVIACSVDRAEARCCVWKITGPNGRTAYLGGSWHLLRSRDYPLPPAYNIAFNASNALAFETSVKDLETSGKMMERAGTYPRGESLKNHVDPRTYSYLQHFFGLLKVPESKWARYKPWFLSFALETPQAGGFEYGLGVERYLQRRAQTNSKPIAGLETAQEHLEIFSGLSERGSEALLLMTFIPADKSSPDSSKMLNAWRNGEADFIARSMHNSFSDFPAMADRLLGNRNRNWIPKIEGYLQSGKTYFVVAGSAHMGGSDGVVALLRAHGYRVEQM